MNSFKEDFLEGLKVVITNTERSGCRYVETDFIPVLESLKKLLKMIDLEIPDRTLNIKINASILSIKDKELRAIARHLLLSLQSEILHEHASYILKYRDLTKFIFPDTLASRELSSEELKLLGNRFSEIVHTVESVLSKKVN